MTREQVIAEIVRVLKQAESQASSVEQILEIADRYIRLAELVRYP
jgi:hypothetical protein